MWYSVQELLSLPGLPGSVRGIQKMADRQCWQSRKRVGRGGGREYHVSSLPPETQAMLTPLEGDLEITPIYKEKNSDDVDLSVGPLGRCADGAGVGGGGDGDSDGRGVERKGLVIQEGFYEGESNGTAVHWQPKPIHQLLGKESSGEFVQGGIFEASGDHGIGIRVSQEGEQEYRQADSGVPREQFGAGESGNAGVSGIRDCNAVGNVGAVGFGLLLESVSRRGEVCPEVMAQARNAVLMAWDEFCKPEGKTKLTQDFIRAYPTIIDPEVYKIIPGFSATTLYNWQKAKKQHGIAGLRPGKPGRNPNDPPYMDALIEGMSLHWPHIPSVYLFLSKTYDGELPSEKTIRRKAKDYAKEHPEQIAIWENPNQARGRFLPAFGNQDNTTKPNQVWQMDSSPMDCYALDEDGQLVRLALIQIRDLFTRRFMFLVTKTSCADAIKLLLRRAILEWGLPEAVKTDNGKDYTSKRLIRFFNQLSIRHLICNPYTPQEKPHVERGFRTLQKSAEYRNVYLAAANVSEWQNLRSKIDKKDFFAFAMTAEQVQEFLDAWCADRCNRRVSTIKATPNERLAQARMNGWKAQMVDDPRKLDLLLLSAPKSSGGDEGYRTVNKGGVSLLGGIYHFVRAHEFVGRQVFVIYEYDDMGRIMVYKDELLSEFIGYGTREDMLTSEEMTAHAQQSKAHYKQRESLGKKIQKKARQQQKAIADNPLGLMGRGDQVLPLIESEMVDLPIALPDYGELKSVETRPRLDPNEVARVQAEFIARQQEPEEETVLRLGESPQQCWSRLLANPESRTGEWEAWMLNYASLNPRLLRFIPELYRESLPQSLKEKLPDAM